MRFRCAPILLLSTFARYESSAIDFPQVSRLIVLRHDLWDAPTRLLPWGFHKSTLSNVLSTLSKVLASSFAAKCHNHTEAALCNLFTLCPSSKYTHPTVFFLLYLNVHGPHISRSNSRRYLVHLFSLVEMPPIAGIFSWVKAGYIHYVLCVIGLYYSVWSVFIILSSRFFQCVTSTMASIVWCLGRD